MPERHRRLGHKAERRVAARALLFRSGRFLRAGIATVLCLGTVAFTIGFVTTPASAQATWNTISSPNAAGSASSGLMGVTCITKSDCWAVGYSSASGGGTTSLAEWWNGTSWSVATTPNPGTAENRLENISCVDSVDCWAVGWQSATQGQSHATVLVEQYDGEVWRVDQVPTISGTASSSLAAVSCWNNNGCQAVGQSVASTGTPANTNTLVEQWNGSSWAVTTGIPSPTSGEVVGSAPYTDATLTG